jgi:hypothetical protein
MRVDKPQRFQVAFAFNKHISGTSSHAVPIVGANICRPTVRNIDCSPLIYLMAEDQSLQQNIYI